VPLRLSHRRCISAGILPGDGQPIGENWMPQEVIPAARGFCHCALRVEFANRRRRLSFSRCQYASRADSVFGQTTLAGSAVSAFDRRFFPPVFSTISAYKTEPDRNNLGPIRLYLCSSLVRWQYLPAGGASSGASSIARPWCQSALYARLN